MTDIMFSRVSDSFLLGLGALGVVLCDRRDEESADSSTAGRVEDSIA